MIKKKTVLVFGAGVSNPYGYPIGQGLVNQIIQSIRNGRFNFLISNGYSTKYLNQFASDLESSTLPSIDIFLENREDYFEIGKICIATQLLSMEDPRVFTKEKAISEGIYPKIFYEMMNGGNWEKIPDNQITIVTFNYDRSWEQFLFTAIKASSGQSDEKVREIINGIGLLHFYGSLPQLKWKKPGGLDYGEFFNMNNIATNFELLKRASEGIILLGEKKVRFENSDIAFAELNKADRIIFLGFGYHEMNIRRLRISDLNIFDKDFPDWHAHSPNHRSGVFRGNAYKLGDAKRKELSQRLGLFMPTISIKDWAFIEENVLLN